MKLPSQVSDAVRKRNPGVPWPQTMLVGVGKRGGAYRPADINQTMPSKPKKRLRQSSKPLLNKLEMEFDTYIYDHFPLNDYWAQAFTLAIGNGVRYTPDFVVKQQGSLTAYEVKGPYARDDAKVKLKVAARLFPCFRWILVSKMDGQWVFEEVLP